VQFFLGTHRPHWLGTLDVPLFVSHNTLKTRKSFPRARQSWALDSGGFTEIKDHGRWRCTPEQYADAVRLYSEQIGRLEWAAPMDWMCEPMMLDRTGLTIREHQERTVANYLELRDQGPFIPVLQGWAIEDYEYCVGLYKSAGVDLRLLPLVGVGSVCRRQATDEITTLMRGLHSYGLRLHGFGVKTGMGSYGQYLESADSMAWSFRARRSAPLPGCTHKNCANCSAFAMLWRERLLAPRPVWINPQMELFA